MFQNIRMYEAEIKKDIYTFKSDVNEQCIACLSTDRNLLHFGQYRDIYRLITADCGYFDELWEENAVLCWECHALLTKLVRFQKQAQKAIELLSSGQSLISNSFSNLSTVLLNNNATLHVTETFIEEEFPLTKDHVEDIDNAYCFDFTNSIETQIIENNVDNFNDHYAEHITQTIIQSENEYEYQKKFTADIKIKTPMENVTKGKLSNNKPQRKMNKDKPWYRDYIRETQEPRCKKKKINDTNINEVISKDNVNEEELSVLMDIEATRMAYKRAKVKCEKCIMVYTKTQLAEHNAEFHLNQGQYFCIICDKRFVGKGEMEVHEKSHYVAFSCRLCEFESIHETSLQEHVRSRHSEYIECLKCQHIFRTESTFRKHYRTFHSRFICDYCGLQFRYKYSIKNHISSRHMNVKLYVCEQCPARYTNTSALWTHTKIKHSRSEAYCVECDKVFINTYKYNLHLYTAKHNSRKIKKYPCPKCGKAFESARFRTNHYKAIHLNQREYSCKPCNKWFAHKSTLVLHTRTVHEKRPHVKNKICSVCGKTFRTSFELRHHHRTHTGERPHGCRLCPAAFSQRGSLLLHVRAKHARDPTQPG